MKNKLIKQLAVLFSITLAFASFNTAIYFLFTKRCLPDNGVVNDIKVIELDKYLPFDENSKIVKAEGETLTGELPIIDGAEGLYPVFSAAVNALYPESSVIFDGEDFSPESKLQMNNSLRAYKGVVDGSSDIVFCTAPSKEQLAYAEENGVTLTLVPIGREAFVFLVNKNNPVSELTIDEVREIYRGNIKMWSEVGGRRVPIAALTRISGSGSQNVLLSFLNGETPAKDHDAFIGSSIGFSFRYYASDVIKNGDIKMLALNGVYPDKASIVSGEYPIIAEFYAVYDSKNENPNVKRVIDWLLSDVGQKMIEDTGYVALSAENSP